MFDFNLIKGRIQKHKLSSIIHNTLELLNAVQRNNDKSFPVWNLFTLIKWSYIHTTDSVLRTPIKEHEYQQLLELIKQFETKYSGISFKNKATVNQSFKIIEEFMKEPIEIFCLQNSIDISILPLQNLCFISIENWDYMMQAIKDGKTTLKEILLKGKELKALDNPAESVMLMEQVLNKHFHPSDVSISYLKDKHLQLDILPDKSQF